MHSARRRRVDRRRSTPLVKKGDLNDAFNSFITVIHRAVKDRDVRLAKQSDTIKSLEGAIAEVQSQYKILSETSANKDAHILAKHADCQKQTRRIERLGLEALEQKASSEKLVKALRTQIGKHA